MPQVNFHTTLSGEAIVTMLYHRRLDADWEAAAEALRSRLAACEGLAGALTLAGRSRGQKLVLGPGHVTERLRVGARQLLYRQVGECGRCMPVMLHARVSRQRLAALCCCTVRAQLASSLLHLQVPGCNNSTMPQLASMCRKRKHMQ